MFNLIQRRIPFRFTNLLVVIVYSLLWLLLDAATLSFETAPEVVLFYPPAGLDFVLLLAFGLQYTPALLIPSAIDGLFLPRTLPPLAVGFYVLTKTFIYGGFCRLLLRQLQFDSRLSRFRDVINFVLFASLIPPLLFGLTTVTALTIAGIVPRSEWLVRVLHFWAGYSIGIVSFAPFGLLWVIPWLKRLLLPASAASVERSNVFQELIFCLSQGSFGQKVIWLLEAVFLLLGTWIAFGIEVDGYPNFLYVAFLPMTWVAVRYGLRVTTIAIPAINIGAAIVESAHIPLASLGSDLARSQFCMLAVSQTALLLGSVITRRMQALARIRQQMLDAQLLNQIGNTLNSTLNPQAILEQIVRLVGENFQVDRVVLWQIDSETVQVLHEWRKTPQVVSALGVSLSRSEWFAYLDEDGDRFQQTVFQSENYQAIQHSPNRTALVREMQVRSIVRVPIFIHEDFFGSLSLHTIEVSRHFTQEEIDLLEQIANQTAIALFNAQSHERLEQLVRTRTAQLEVANRAKSDFLATMSHELRTPLTSIIGFSSVLRQQVFGSLEPRQLQYVELIHSAGEHLLALVNDILDLARIEAQREEMEFVEVPIAELCQGCLASVQYQAETKGLALDLEIAPDVTVCTADLRRLRQILINLLANAVKFTARGLVRLQVTRSVQPEPDQILFTVIDTGIGITAADLDRLFEPFEQLESGLNRRQEGTGLGLALSQRLAGLMGGEITVESEPGRGSRFTLRLPIVPSENRQT
ncbi:ATP-binding protein [Leptolyngbya ohadii]|uniref:ATP-binding protein n=1 Tax=Leptolyngbya ohadii TaxID=1962290 RepID=UPI000B599494|nr:ATP-binding protein [Leptolyngbya ohadii]